MVKTDKEEEPEPVKNSILTKRQKKEIIKEMKEKWKKEGRDKNDKNG